MSSKDSKANRHVTWTLLFPIEGLAQVADDVPLTAGPGFQRSQSEELEGNLYRILLKLLE